MSIFERNRWAFVLVCGALIAGCANRPFPLTAQRGSSMVVPLDAWDTQPRGFGGTQVQDPQRGTMIYYLDGDTDQRLTTRASTLVAPHPASYLARSASFVGTQYEMVSIVDIPTTAPLGAHTLYARHQPVSGPLGSPINLGQIEILSEVVEGVTGKSTPFQFNPIDYVVPDPMIVVNLPGSAYAARVRIMSGFDNTNFELLDAFESYVVTAPNHRPMAWWTLNTTPTTTVIGDFVAATNNPFFQVAFVFRRRYGSTSPPLVATNLVVRVQMWDADGAVFFADQTINSNLVSIQ